MEAKDVIKLQELKNTLAAINKTIDKLSEKKNKLSKIAEQSCETWKGTAAESFLAQTDEMINSLSVCITKLSSTKTVVNKQITKITNSR